jgi:hypothetical protein
VGDVLDEAIKDNSGIVSSTALGCPLVSHASRSVWITGVHVCVSGNDEMWVATARQVIERKATRRIPRFA